MPRPRSHFEVAFRAELMAGAHRGRPRRRLRYVLGLALALAIGGSAAAVSLHEDSDGLTPGGGQDQGSPEPEVDPSATLEFVPA